MNITDDMFQPAPPTSPFNSSIQSSPGFFPASPGSEYTKMQILLHASPRVQSGTTLYLSLLTCTTIAITVTLAGFLHKTNTPFLSPPTLLIFLGLLSQTAYTASSAYFFDNPFSKPGKAINILFFATTLVLYAWQQWTRSHQVFHLTSTPFFLTLFKSILIAFTLLAYIPLLLLAIPIPQDNFLVTNVTARALVYICVVSLDMFFLVNFIRYILRATVSTIEVKGIEKCKQDTIPLFQVTAWYGFLASTGVFVSAVLFVATGVVAVKGKSLVAYVVLSCVQKTGMVFVSGVVALQKAALVKLRRKGLEAKRMRK